MGVIYRFGGGRFPKSKVSVLVPFLVTIGVALFASQDAASSVVDPANTFKTQCATCHGVDGAGATVGKTLGVKDLRSAEVQKQPDAVLAQVIRGGRGNMPQFGQTLTAGQITGLVRFVRTLKGESSSVSSVQSTSAQSTSVQSTSGPSTPGQSSHVSATVSGI